MQVVHTFNPDISKQGTVEDIDDGLAKTLIKTGRVREATEEEIADGHGAELKPAKVPAETADTLATAAEAPAPPAKAELPAGSGDTDSAPPSSTSTPTPAKAEPKKTAGGAAPSSTSTPAK